MHAKKFTTKGKFAINRNTELNIFWTLTKYMYYIIWFQVSFQIVNVY